MFIQGNAKSDERESKVFMHNYETMNLPKAKVIKLYSNSTIVSKYSNSSKVWAFAISLIISKKQSTLSSPWIPLFGKCRESDCRVDSVVVMFQRVSKSLAVQLYIDDVMRKVNIATVNTDTWFSLFIVMTPNLICI